LEEKTTGTAEAIGIFDRPVEEQRSHTLVITDVKIICTWLTVNMGISSHVNAKQDENSILEHYQHQ